ncbi:MAG: NERD domain-containing protein [Candidatus Aenigmatarchaeota archaeon]
MELEDIKKEMLSGKEIEEILQSFDWKEFENIVAEIFESNNFMVYRNFRFKNKKRYEIDLLAMRNKIVFCVDCKEWGKGRYKKTGIKNAARRQIERVKELNSNKRELKNIGISTCHKIYPLIITLFEEDLKKEGSVLVVPVWKLNSFLNEIETIYRYF